ncbi:hypothetical protein SLEP1_g37474 [Rubroshorea leprosula]|uniref:Uncharacterized protein n=1 Tax=Rubroshorea leprosula TaxID=152421 RepID=A0AAV5KUX4_9ROSI|nr:hypothetical protein SLEP1_g37474 [Rubroshorea leprosula]
MTRSSFPFFCMWNFIVIWGRLITVACYWGFMRRPGVALQPGPGAPHPPPIPV